LRPAAPALELLVTTQWRITEADRELNDPDDRPLGLALNESAGRRGCRGESPRTISAH
jgi:hypothetical protein